jgi:xanthine dehydrogenase accessory factor
MRVWRFINDKLEKEIPVVLLYVLDSEGSSPGRQGFKMAVANDGEISGTIGGGIMEHKLVELSRSALKNGEEKIILKPQIHDQSKGKNRSGMICSGNQFISLIPLNQPHKNTIEKIVSVSKERKSGFLEITPSGFSFSEKKNLETDDGKVFKYENEENWSYAEKINSTDVIHIIGGGHVGLALSEAMTFLGFYVKIYDDRSELNTLEQNRFAQEKIIVDYEKMDEQMDFHNNDFVAIMTFGYRTDKVILKQLYDKKFAYIGMMGSASKVAQMFNELESEGISKEHLKHIKTPIGINISSKTTMEIAISVASEIISEKNKKHPSQRK